MLSGEDLLGSLVDSDLKFFEIFLIGLVFYVVHNISEVGFLSKDTFHIFDLLLNDSHINTHLSGGLVVLPDTFINHFELEIESLVDYLHHCLLSRLHQVVDAAVNVLDIFISLQS